MQMRTRECVNPKPRFGGIPCKGSTTVMRGCTNTSSCQQVPVRITGAKVGYGGRVEVFYRGRWGKICRNEWDINDVKVVCKQLGFRGALAEFMTGNITTDKSIPVVMSDIACTGQESVLAQCNRSDGDHRCPEDIGAQALCVPNNVKVLETKSLSFNLGSTETVKCSLKNENQNEREMVKWYEIGTTARELKSEGRIEVNGETLTIKDIQLRDGGTYECRGVGYTRFYTVYVNAQFKNKRPHQYLIYGKPGKIRCTAEGNPRPQFEWRKNEKLLLKDDRLKQLSDGSLQIDTVWPEDEGAYKCSMKQSKGNERITVDSQAITVYVIVPPSVQLSRLPDNVLEGGSVTLICAVDGSPQPQKISWFKDKRLFTEGNKTFVIRNITEEAEGTYACEAKNDGGAANDSIDIIVDASPKLDAALKKDSVLVLLHSTLQLKCIERGDPEPNVTWTNNGTQVANNNTVVITNATFKDAGQYECVAMNRAGNVSGQIWIDVVVYPVVDVYPRNQTVPEGKTTNISCKDQGVPLPKLSWTFDDGELTPTALIMNTTDGSLLQLPNTTKRMEGRYKCKATNKAGEAYSTSTLHVLEKPTVVISGEAYQTRLEGDKLNLTCLAREPTSEIRWTIKTVSRGKMANVTKNEDKSILIIERVEVSDSGEYVCEANNTAGSASSSVDIIVRVYPVVEVYPRNQTVPEGKTTNISCEAKGVPLPKLSWKFDKGELSPTAVIMNTSDGSLLQLPNTTKRMEGRYKCRATNKAGEEHSTSILHVLEKPTVVISGESYQRKLEGDKLTLTCKTTDPTSEIRWTINTDFRGEMANITKNGDRSILIIASVKVSDSGEYICEAYNAAGTASSSVYVEVRALQVHVQAAIEWYYIVGPVSAVAVTAFIACYLYKRRIKGCQQVAVYYYLAV
ncbi:hemicentin-1-like [Montipora capricornis]|uniref:hemicentin-1-like n=1 Tax=Montipora capricornis TaxID=246305 RepID=UPI0035F17A80